MARPHHYKKGKYRYKYVGRIGKLSEEVVTKLEQAFAIGANVSQACYHAGIARQTYYRWIEENPELNDRINDIKERLPLKALQNIAARIETPNAVTGDIGLSKWLLERRNPNEFGETLKLDHGGQISHVESIDPAVEAIRGRYHEEMRALTRKNYEQKKIQQTNHD